MLAALYDRPIVAVDDVRGLTELSYAAANNVVGRLVELGILTEITGNARHRRFQHLPYVRLFSE